MARPLVVKRNDMVRVIAGADKGKVGKVLRVRPERGQVIVEKLHLVKRHRRARGLAQPGGIVEKEAPIHVSNVRLVCPKCHQAIHPRRTRQPGGKRARFCPKCGEGVDET